MSQIKVQHKGPLRGEITPPPDKSISHRAIMFSSLAAGKSIIRNFLRAEDPLSTLAAFRQMGIDIEVRSEKSEIRSNGEVKTPVEVTITGKGLYGLKEAEEIIDCGNSGTTMRLMSGILAGQKFSSTLAGDQSLSRRPMNRIISPLTEMGAIIESERNGYPPLHIKSSHLNPIRYRSPVASAQVKSAVLLAGLYCDGTTTVTETGKSRDHTERMLKACGANIRTSGLEVSITGKDPLKPLDLTVPADLSSAAFFIVAGLIIPGSEILIKKVGINPTRTGLIDILKMMGADIRLENRLEVSGEPVADIYVRHSQLSGIKIGEDLVLKAIDEFPILSVAAAKAEGKTTITGAAELRVKESDRIASIASELRRMGVSIEEFEDGLSIEGRDNLNPGEVRSYGDHRIAMSMAIAGLTIKNETVITNTDCVDTSFPGFMDMIEKLHK